MQQHDMEQHRGSFLDCLQNQVQTLKKTTESHTELLSWIVTQLPAPESNLQPLRNANPAGEKNAWPGTTEPILDSQLSSSDLQEGISKRDEAYRKLAAAHQALKSKLREARAVNLEWEQRSKGGASVLKAAHRRLSCGDVADGANGQSLSQHIVQSTESSLQRVAALSLTTPKLRNGLSTVHPPQGGLVEDMIGCTAHKHCNICPARTGSPTIGVEPHSWRQSLSALEENEDSPPGSMNLDGVLHTPTTPRKRKASSPISSGLALGASKSSRNPRGGVSRNPDPGTCGVHVWRRTKSMTAKRSKKHLSHEQLRGSDDPDPGLHGASSTLRRPLLTSHTAHLVLASVAEAEHASDRADVDQATGGGDITKRPSINGSVLPEKGLQAETSQSKLDAAKRVNRKTCNCGPDTAMNGMASGVEDIVQASRLNFARGIGPGRPHHFRSRHSVCSPLQAPFQGPEGLRPYPVQPEAYQNRHLSLGFRELAGHSPRRRPVSAYKDQRYHNGQQSQFNKVSSFPHETSEANLPKHLTQTSRAFVRRDRNLIRTSQAGEPSQIIALPRNKTSPSNERAKPGILADQSRRHRQAHARPTTPPGWWNTDMLSTQELAEQAQQARQTGC